MRASVNFEDDTVAVFRIAVLCLGFLIAACGQTGPLVLPEKNDAPTNASAQSK
jgi:predicted small lipoprotein YifL